MAELYGIATQAYDTGRQRAQRNRLAQLTSQAVSGSMPYNVFASQLAAVDPAAGLEIANAIQDRQIAEQERGRARGLGLARYLRSIPAEVRGNVAAAYRSKAPELPESLDDQSLDAYMSMAQQSGLGDARVQSRFVGEDGQVYAMMSNSPYPVPTGIKAEESYSALETTDESGRPIAGAFNRRFGTLGGFGGQQPAPQPQVPQAGTDPRIENIAARVREMETSGVRQDIIDGFVVGEMDRLGIDRKGAFSTQTAPQQRPGLIVGPDPVTQAGRIEEAKARGRIGAELELSPAVAQAAANLERLRELAKGEAQRENERISNRTGMVVALNQADNSTAAIEELVQNSIEPLISNWTTGTLGTFMSFIPGTDASDLEANLETLKAVAGFSELTALKARGGTLGALSEGERAALESLWGTLRNSQSPEAFRANLGRYMTRVQQAWEAIALEFEKRYGQSAADAVGEFRGGLTQRPDAERPGQAGGRTYQVGQEIEVNGRRYRVTGGDPSDPDVEEIR